MSKRFRIFLIVLLALTALIGGSFIAVMIYLSAAGLWEVAIGTIFNYFSQGASSTLIIFWGLLLPVFMIAFLVFTLIRYGRVNKVVIPYEQGIKAAIEEEKKNIVEAAQKQTKRFGMLVEKSERGHSDVDSLSELCAKFRAFSASRLNLYFGESEIREFIAGLASSHLIILQGASGSGKTSLAFAFGEFISNPSTIIPVQPMWKERADLIGYYNEFTKKYNDTTLFRKMYEANGSDKMFITVLDEMNIARVEYYFAEFLSLMEIPDPELRYLEIVPDKFQGDPERLKDGCIKLPENMWFVGTVNNDDSAFPISDKVYDRSMILSLKTRADRFAASEQDRVNITSERFCALVKEAQTGYELSDINKKRLSALDDHLAKNLNVSYGNRIRKQIGDFVAAYVKCGGDEVEALDIVMARKVLFKLEYKDVSKYQAEFRKLGDFIEDTFGKGKMRNCLEYIDAICN